MTSHLQIAFPAAISRFPEIFTSFHTTFRVHNNKWCHFWDSALELGSWLPFQRSPEHFTPLAASGHLQTTHLDFGLICIHGASRIHAHCKYCSVSFEFCWTNIRIHTRNFLKYVYTRWTMYKQNLKTECTHFAILWDKQSRRYCKTICKNLHHHVLSCRLHKLRLRTQYINS